MLRELADGADSARWTRFVDIYTPVLRYWLDCLRRGPLPSLTMAMYDDIVQETLVSMMKVFPTRRYDRNRARFRSFLSAILRKRAIDFLRQSGYAALNFMPDSEMEAVIESSLDASARTDASESEEFRELRLELWRLLIDRVFRESRFSGRSQAIFLRSVAGESDESLAREFGMERNAIYQTRFRIVKKLEEKARALSRGSKDIMDIIAALERE